MLINPNTNAATTELMVATFRAALAEHSAGPAGAGLADYPVVGLTAQLGPPMITTEDELAAAAGATIAAYRQWLTAQQQPAAIVVAGFGDPGLDVLSRQPVPVLGIGSQSVRQVAERVRAAGGKFGIATTTPGLADSLDALCAMERDVLAGIEFTAAAPNELAADPAAQDAQLADAVARLVHAGATEVIIGGGPLTASAQRLLDLVGTDGRFATAAGEPVRISLPLAEVARSLAPLLTP